MRLVPRARQAAALADDADPDERAALGATLLHVLRETIATAHPIIPFVTEELWDLLGYTEAEGLLAAGRLPEPDDALRDPARRGARWSARSRRSRRCATWRDSVGVKAGAVVPGVLRAGGYEQTAARDRRRSRASTSRDATATSGAEPVATIAIPGGAVGVLASDAVDLGAADRRLAAAARDARARDRARRAASSPTRASSPRRRPAVVAAERGKLERLREELAALPAAAGGATR